MLIELEAQWSVLVMGVSGVEPAGYAFPAASYGVPADERLPPRRAGLDVGRGVTLALVRPSMTSGSEYWWAAATRATPRYRRLRTCPPRTAATQRDWLAAGNGYPVAPGTERPGDLVFWDSYRGPNTIGHVMIVWDPAGQRTIEANSSRTGVGQFSYASGPRHNIFEIWRIGNIADDAPA